MEKNVIHFIAHAAQTPNQLQLSLPDPGPAGGLPLQPEWLISEEDMFCR